MREWRVLPKIKDEQCEAYPNMSRIFLQLLFNRGLKSEEEIKTFLNGELADNLARTFSSQADYAFYDPFLFKDMEQAVDIIIKHIKDGNPIVVYGDYDADGVTASVILLETLKLLHAQVEVYLPDRVSEGYGLNKMAINQILEAGFKLVITVDNGIRNKEEVEYAKAKGLEIIITDHHVLPEEIKDLPDCPIINPADKRNNYPCPFLAGVGVSFKLISALLFKSNLSDKQKQLIAEKCLDLVAVGTIADMVSLLGENRLLVKKGLEVLNENRRLGLKELINSTKANGDKKLEAWNVSWQIAPRLNAASRLSHANTAFALLTTTDENEAKELAEELNRRNASRQEITKEIIAQVEKQIDSENLPDIIIGVAGEDEIWNEGVIGLVAGKIAEKYYRPTLIITRLIESAEFDPEKKKLIPKKVSFKGSGRSIPELNLIAVIEDCAEELDKYGGHPMACGFSINNEDNLTKFTTKIERLVSEKLAGQNLVPKIEIEAEVKMSEISLHLAEEINQLAPFGQNNLQPKLVSYDLTIEDIVFMGFENQHIKIRVAGFWAIAFGLAEQYKQFQVGDQVDLAYYLEINDFNGRREAQLKIIDLKFSK
ncbi:MAG: single-stranded-DNA-specific exonuclease RecJ [Patescibacteria group bacterium]|jgi:single-stranded-DNA-specific exonuclease|nr:single-stranded-DNA-specific exonuclease RecJ [bacterium]HQC49858.1 single-stranded-DNA-specific exonuclease RecJ [bacterium]